MTEKVFVPPSWCHLNAANPPKFETWGFKHERAEKSYCRKLTLFKTAKALKKWKTEYVKLVKLTVFSLSLQTVFFFSLLPAAHYVNDSVLCGKHSVMCAKLHYRLTAILSIAIFVARTRADLNVTVIEIATWTKSDTNSTCLNLLLSLKVGNTI